MMNKSVCKNQSDFDFTGSCVNVMTRILKKCYHNFATKTTVPAISRITFGQCNAYTIMWTLALLSGTFLAVWQSKSLFENFLERKSDHVTDWEFPSEIEFPAVTMCTNSPLAWRTALQKKSHTALQMQKEIEDYKGNIDNTYYLTTEVKLLTMLMTVPEKERKPWGMDKDDFIVYCRWEGNDCQTDLITFNNVYYGNCFTFNTDFNQTGYLAKKSSALTIIFKLKADENFPFMFRDHGPATVIHPPKTAPVLNFASAVVIYPGYQAQFTLTKNVIQRLPEPYPSKCVDQNNMDIRQRSFYFSEEWPYLYSSEACLMSCLQDLHIQKCNCIYDSRYPLPASLMTNSSMQLCSKDICNLTDNRSALESCVCSKPCNEAEYNYNMLWNKQWRNQERWKSLVKKHSKAPYATGEDLVLLDVSFGSNFVSVSQEVPVITVAEFLSRVGGNLGLLLGISLLSLFDIPELLINIIVSTIAYMKWKISSMLVMGL